MSYEQIAYEVDDRVATITLDRPDRLNAFTGTMMREVLEAVDTADADDGVRAVIFTGRGRAYCAGADLGSGGQTFDHSGDEGGIEDHRDGGGLLTLRLFQSRKPLIAAINGPAVGVGITMTLPMDVRIASTEARMGFVFARRGIVTEAASSWFLPRVVGVSTALEWVLTGRVFDAREALDRGLVRSLHEPDELLPAARALAAEIADNTSAVSVALMRQMLWRLLGASHPMDAHRADSRAIFELGRSPDAREGVKSFLEKRPPHFTMSAARDLPDVFPGWEEPTFS